MSKILKMIIGLLCLFIGFSFLIIGICRDLGYINIPVEIITPASILGLGMLYFITLHNISS